MYDMNVVYHISIQTHIVQPAAAADRDVSAM